MLALETYQCLSLGTQEPCSLFKKKIVPWGRPEHCHHREETHRSLSHQFGGIFSKPKGIELQVLALGIVLSSHREPMAFIIKAARLSTLLALPSSPFFSPLPQRVCWEFWEMLSLHSGYEQRR